MEFPYKIMNKMTCELAKGADSIHLSGYEEIRRIALLRCVFRLSEISECDQKRFAQICADPDQRKLYFELKDSFEQRILSENDITGFIRNVVKL